MSDQDEQYTADNVRKQIERAKELRSAQMIENFDEALEEFMRMVVEEGTYTPEARLPTQFHLTWRNRLTGSVERDVKGLVCLGMIMGAALERDVPMGSEVEEAWKNGEVVLSEESDQDE